MKKLFSFSLKSTLIDIKIEIKYTIFNYFITYHSWLDSLSDRINFL